MNFSNDYGKQRSELKGFPLLLPFCSLSPAPSRFESLSPWEIGMWFCHSKIFDKLMCLYIKIRALVPFWSHLFLSSSLPLTGLLELHWPPLRFSSNRADMLFLPQGFTPALKLFFFFFLRPSLPRKKCSTWIFLYPFFASGPYSDVEDFLYNLFKIAPLSPTIPNLPSLPFLWSTHHHLTCYIFCLLAHVSSMMVREFVYFMLICNPCALNSA